MYSTLASKVKFSFFFVMWRFSKFLRFDAQRNVPIATAICGSIGAVGGGGMGAHVCTELDSRRSLATHIVVTNIAVGFCGAFGGIFGGMSGILIGATWPMPLIATGMASGIGYMCYQNGQKENFDTEHEL
jgi:hypothetical protein